MGRTTIPSLLLCQMVYRSQADVCKRFIGFTKQHPSQEKDLTAMYLHSISSPRLSYYLAYGIPEVETLKSFINSKKMVVLPGSGIGGRLDGIYASPIQLSKENNMEGFDLLSSFFCEKAIERPSFIFTMPPDEPLPRISPGTAGTTAFWSQNISCIPVLSRTKEPKIFCS